MPIEDSERSRIIEAAHQCLASSRGGVPVTAILSVAGLSTRAFYRHFASKDALLLALYRRDGERLLADLRATADAATSPPQALRRWIEGLLQNTTDARRRRRVLVLTSEELMRASGYAAERARWTVAARAAIAAILERGVADGSMPWARPEPDARTIVAALAEAFQDQMADGSRAGAARAAAQLMDFAFRALGAHDRA